jgi:hypothetical protein
MAHKLLLLAFMHLITVAVMSAPKVLAPFNYFSIWMLTPVQCTVKADSHIACRAYAVPLPCRAAKVLECVFPI